MVRKAQADDTGNPHVEQAKHFILTHITQEVTAEAVAGHVGLSQSHLSRLFRSHVGKTMHEYLVDKRVEMACQLLATADQEIRRIAATLRFCDQSHLTQAFRKRTGMTPATYRRTYRRKA